MQRIEDPVVGAHEHQTRTDTCYQILVHEASIFLSLANR